MGVSKEDQKRYLKLHNQFDADTTTWSERLNREFEGKMLVMSKVTVSRMSKEKPFKVWAIHSTNGFRNGVCIKMSRFNHYFWNADTRTRDYGQVLRERAIYGQNAFYNTNLYWSKAFGCVVEGEMFMTGWTDWCWDIRGTTTSRS